MNSPAAPTKSVLIADDDPIFVDLATACLERDGFRTVVANDGATAMEMLLNDPVDLAIIDGLMPQIDGLRLIALIRATPQLKSLPVLVITSLEDASVQSDGMQVGANAFLTKPIDWPKLPALVRELIAP